MRDGKDIITGVGHGSATLAQKAELMEALVTQAGEDLRTKLRELYGEKGAPFVMIAAVPRDDMQTITIRTNMPHPEAGAMCGLVAMQFVPPPRPMQDGKPVPEIDLAELPPAL